MGKKRVLRVAIPVVLTMVIIIVNIVAISVWNERRVKTGEWWVNLSEEQIREELVSKLVWLNECTGEIYYGEDGLTWGFNIDGNYGGLKLVENPYNVYLGTATFTAPDRGIENTSPISEYEITWAIPNGEYYGDVRSITFEDKIEIEEPDSKEPADIQFIWG